MTDPAALDLTEVNCLLAERGVECAIHHRITCGSTNEIAKQMLSEGAETGTTVVAEHQSAGRGRFQRAWASGPALNLLFSVVVRWPIAGFKPTWLTPAAGLAIRDAMDSLHPLTPQIKWPNDVMFEGYGEIFKMAGVLSEASTMGEEWGCIVGMGVNVNQVWEDDDQEPGRPRGSIASVIGEEVSREVLFAEILAKFAERVHLLKSGETQSIVEDARRHLWGIGRRVAFETPGLKWSGTLLGVDDEYHLLVEDDDGEQRKLSAGEVLFGEEVG